MQEINAAGKAIILFSMSCFLFFGCPTKNKKESKTEIIVESFNTGENNYIRSLAVEDNFLWVGTSGGVLKVDTLTGNLLNTYTTKDGLKSNYVFAIGVDRNKVKWFGTNAGGMTRFDGTNWQTYMPMHGLADQWVYAFAFADDGMMWIGTWAGANKFDGKNFITYAPKDGLINEWVYGLGLDKNGGVWFGTEGGVSFFDGNQWKSWTDKDGLGLPNLNKLNQSANSGLGTIDRHNLSVLDTTGKETYNPNYIFCALVDGNNNKWFGSWGGGVSRFDGKQWKNFSMKDGLSGNIVYSMALDKKGIFWFGTNHGLSSYDGKIIKNYNKKDGLIDENVYAIAVDNRNIKWIGQKGGVVKLYEQLVTPKKTLKILPSQEKPIPLLEE